MGYAAKTRAIKDCNIPIPKILSLIVACITPGVNTWDKFYGGFHTVLSLVNLEFLCKGVNTIL